MATLTSTRPTLLDITKRMAPDGSIDTEIAEMLTEVQDWMKYAYWQEGNLPTGNRDTIRTSLQTPTWRKLNAGTQPTKSTTAQNVDSCGILEIISEIDVKEAQLNGNEAAWRMSEERPAIDAMGNELGQTLIYGNEATASEEFTGLKVRYDSLSAENATHVLVDSGASGSTNTSIWLVGWGRMGARMLYPKAGKPNLQINDLGRQLLENADGNNGRMLAYVTQYTWDVGFGIKDWRNVVRFQYQPSDVTYNGATGPRLEDNMRKMVRRIQNLGSLTMTWLLNRQALDDLDLQSANKSTMAFNSIKDAQGQNVDAFLGIPLTRCDSILTTEAVIT